MTVTLKKRSSIYASFQQFPFFNPVFYLVKSYPVYSGILNGMVINSHNIFLIVSDSVMRYLTGSLLVPLFAAHFYFEDFAAIFTKLSVSVDFSQKTVYFSFSRFIKRFIKILVHWRNGIQKKVYNILRNRVYLTKSIEKF